MNTSSSDSSSSRSSSHSVKRKKQQKKQKSTNKKLKKSAILETPKVPEPDDEAIKNALISVANGANSKKEAMQEETTQNSNPPKVDFDPPIVAPKPAEPLIKVTQPKPTKPETVVAKAVLTAKAPLPENPTQLQEPKKEKPKPQTPDPIPSESTQQIINLICQSYKTIQMDLLNLRANLNTASDREGKLQVIEKFEQKNPELHFFTINLSKRFSALNPDLAQIDFAIRQSLLKDMLVADVVNQNGAKRIVGGLFFGSGTKLQELDSGFTT